MRTYGALPNTTITIIQAIDEREIPSIGDEAPVSVTKGADFEHSLASMHEAERKIPAYPKFAFA
jgi:hypothetical protein